MITVGLEGSRQALKGSLSLVIYQRRFAMHWLWCANNVPSVDLSDRLMPQAYAQQRDTRPKCLNDLARKACLIGCARPRRDYNALRLQGFNLVQCHLVVASYLDLCAQLTQILVQIIGKTIVVID